LAGGFVVTGVAAAVWVSFLLGAKPTGSGLPFTVKFSLAQGAAGLKPGSPVMLGGQQIGQVKGVSFEKGDDGLPKGVLVGVEVDQSVFLYENAGVYLDRPLLGTLSSINIASVGDSKVEKFQGKPQIESGDVVAGAIAPPAMLASAGFGPEQSKAVGEIIDSAKRSMLDLERIEQWRTEVDATLASVRAATKDAEEFSKKLPGVADDAKAFIAKGSEFADKVTKVIDENRADVRATIESVKSATAKFDQVTVDKINTTLGEIDKALEVFSIGVKNVDQILQDGRFDLKQTLANMSLASQEMKLTMSEVRAAPWRVFYKPTLKERETEDLYGAAGAFAEAAGLVRSASEALAAASGSQVQAPDHAEHLKELRRELDESIDKYREAGKRLMDELVEQK
jgi:ABC-type transporter Mla subunit MlaD